MAKGCCSPWKISAALVPGNVVAVFEIIAVMCSGIVKELELELEKLLPCKRSAATFLGKL
jgi:hypothetical protein